MSLSKLATKICSSTSQRSRQFHLFFPLPSCSAYLKAVPILPYPGSEKGSVRKQRGFCRPLGAQPRHGPASACGHVVSVPGTLASPGGGRGRTGHCTPTSGHCDAFSLGSPTAPPWPDSICHHQSSRLQNKLWVNTELQGVAGREGWARGGAAESRAVAGVAQAA